MNFRKKRSDLIEINEMQSDDNSLKKSSLKVERIIQFQSDTKIDGNLISPDSCCFNGKIKGDIIIDGKLVLGEVSEVIGDVRAKDLIVKGKVVGSVFVEGKTVISSCSNVRGNSLTTHLLEVETGAVLNIKNIVVRSTESPDDVLDESVDFPRKDSLPQNDNVLKNNSDQHSSSNNGDNPFLFQMFQDQ